MKSCVTKIATVSEDGRSVIACGYGNGCIHLLDLRLDKPLVAAVTDHQNWVVDIHRQRRSKHLLVSASVAGQSVSQRRFFRLLSIASSVPSTHPLLLCPSVPRSLVPSVGV